MSACAVWELVLTLVALVSLGLAYHFKNLASRMRKRARVYIQYVPRDQLTIEERCVFDSFRRDAGIR
jgi:hypothetical protein